MQTSHTKQPVFLSVRNFIKNLFSIKEGADLIGADEYIKSSISFQGPNAWALIFGIIVASVGLSINSIPAIIGAMLISPLMGPIIGIGFAVGTYNYSFLKKSLKNLFIFVVLSILVSMIYFLLSPVPTMQSELLARTKPTFFDVLIAFFGGAAGIVSISRKDKGTIIAGMAIATALMPPLCTAGFALATQNFVGFAGALYLFIINTVFIIIATYLFVIYLNFPQALSPGEVHKTFVNKVIMFIGLIVIIPSVFMAWYLQRESAFFAKTDLFIKKEIQAKKIILVSKEASFNLKSPQVTLVLLGDNIDTNTIETIKKRAQDYSIPENAIDITAVTVTESLSKKLYASLGDVESTIKKIQTRSENLEKELLLNLTKKEQIISNINKNKENFQNVTLEMKILFPEIQSVFALDAIEFDPKSSEKAKSKIVLLWKSIPDNTELKKSDKFIRHKFNSQYDCCLNFSKF